MASPLDVINQSLDINPRRTESVPLDAGAQGLISAQQQQARQMTPEAANQMLNTSGAGLLKGPIQHPFASPEFEQAMQSRAQKVYGGYEQGRGYRDYLQGSEISSRASAKDFENQTILQGLMTKAWVRDVQFQTSIAETRSAILAAVTGSFGQYAALRNSRQPAVPPTGGQDPVESASLQKAEFGSMSSDYMGFGPGGSRQLGR